MIAEGRPMEELSVHYMENLAEQLKPYKKTRYIAPGERSE
jgi:hypothetical protein